MLCATSRWGGGWLMPWNDGLDPGSTAYQIAASQELRIRVLAGPGAGKSFAMKRRVARLLEDGSLSAGQVLAVTFTRVAAEDLHRELVSLEVPNAEDLNGRTLHSLAMEILMRNHVMETLGRTPRPLNGFELNPLLEDLNPAYGTKHERRKLIGAYVAAWSRLQHEVPGYAATAAEQAFADELTDWLVLHQAMHIGEVIPHLYQYLRDNPGAPERGEFRHILIDEYQDLNRVEQEALALLGEAGAVCVIGDDDQSIYSFKHAHPAGVREWAQVHNAEDHEIGECRRCPTTIVQMANSLIGFNQDRLPRQMAERPENGVGQVVIRQFQTADDEAAAVAAKIAQLIEDGVAPGDIIVLAQRAAFGTPVFHRLRDAGVPCKSYYEESALETEAAQERFAVFKLFLDQEDRVSLRWLLGCNHNRWHAPAYGRVMAHMRQSGLSPWETMTQLASGTLSIPHTASLVARFNEIVHELDGLSQAEGLDAFIAAWLPDPEAVSLLHEAVTACREEAEDVGQLFDGLYDAITAPEVPLEVAEVRVMSLHKSKGLSSRYVFIVGCVEGLIPSRPEAGTPQDIVRAKLEEDRRLFYVGLTRVKASPEAGRPGYLAITYPMRMPAAEAFRSQIAAVSTQGNVAVLRASRFLAQLGPTAPAPAVGEL